MSAPSRVKASCTMRNTNLWCSEQSIFERYGLLYIIIIHLEAGITKGFLIRAIKSSRPLPNLFRILLDKKSQLHIYISHVHILGHISWCSDHQSFKQSLASVSAGRKNNWPPLPEKFPVGPCFYHDIAVDIPVEFQKTVKIMYNLWMCKWTNLGIIASCSLSQTQTNVLHRKRCPAACLTSESSNNNKRFHLRFALH